jgi:NAD-dependent DNA ligase
MAVTREKMLEVREWIRRERAELEKAQNAYHLTDKQLMTDEEFDRREAELRDYVEKYNRKVDANPDLRLEPEKPL